MNGEAATALDARLMAAALRLGRRGLGRTWPNPSVACLIVRFDGGTPIIVGRGVTAIGGRPHAETQALAEASDSARGATAYVTLEPCSHHGKTPPCAQALIAADVARVVVALGDPDPRVAGRGVAMLRAAGITVVENVGTETAARDHAGHLTRVRLGRPHVVLKMALSADGKVGRRGERVLITGETANAHVHMMRAMSDAIMVGVGTVLADDPLLTVRLPGMEATSPVRVVVDTDLDMPASARLAMSAPEVPTHVLAAWGAEPLRAAALEAEGVVIHRVSTPFLSRGGINLAIGLRELVKLGIGRLMVEGGQRLAQALIDGGFVDEIVLLTGPEPIGADGIPGPRLPPTFRPVATRALGPDLMTRYMHEKEC